MNRCIVHSIVHLDDMRIFIAGRTGGTGSTGSQGAAGVAGATGATGVEYQSAKRRVARQAAGCPGQLIRRPSSKAYYAKLPKVSDILSLFFCRNRGAGTIRTPTIPTLTIPTRTIPTVTIPTNVIIVGLLSAYWRSPAPRSTCGTGRVRVRVSDTGACRNGECRVTVRVGMVSVGMVLVGIVRVGMVTCTHRNQIPRLLPLHQKILCRYVRHCPVERTPCRDPRNSYIETKRHSKSKR